MAHGPSSFTTLGTTGDPVPHTHRAQPALVLMNGTELPVMNGRGGDAGQKARGALASGGFIDGNVVAKDGPNVVGFGVFAQSLSK